MKQDLPIVVFLPPKGGNRLFWEHQERALAGHANCHHITLDHEDNIEDMAARVSSIIETFGGKAALAGCSMGGTVALKVAVDNPGKISGLFLVGTTARADDPVLREKRLAATTTYPDDGNFPGITDQQMLSLIHNASHKPAVARDVNDVFTRTSCAVMKRHSRAVANRPDLREELANLSSIPVWTIGGGNDQKTPIAETAEIAELIGSNAQLVVIGNCGHLPPLEEPEQVSREMKVWARMLAY